MSNINMITLWLKQIIEKIIFNKLSKRYGGRLKDNMLGAYSKLLLEAGNDSMNKMQHSTNERDLLDAVCHSTSIHFVNNGGFNAFACAEGKRNFVGIYAGVPTILADLCVTIMCCNRIWSSLGEEPRPTDISDHLSDIFLAAEFGIDKRHERIGYTNSMYEMPTNKARFQVANDIFFIAAYFLIYHELCHIARGHIDLLCNQANLSVVMFESVSNQVAHDDHLKRQWLELDADRRASFFILDHFDWDKSWNSINGHTENSDYSATMALRLILFAIGVVFILFDYKKEPIDPDAPRTHPHPAIRLAHSFELIAAFLAKYHSAPIDICTEVMTDVLKDFNELGEIVDRNLIGYIPTDEALLENQLKRILSVFDEVQLESAWEKLHRRVQ